MGKGSPRLVLPAPRNVLACSVILEYKGRFRPALLLQNREHITLPMPRHSHQQQRWVFVQTMRLVYLGSREPLTPLWPCFPLRSLCSIESISPGVASRSPGALGTLLSLQAKRARDSVVPREALLSLFAFRTSIAWLSLGANLAGKPHQTILPL